MNVASAGLRRKVAREAAALLYFRLEKEYKQAKVKAAENLGVRVLPTNLEVALELDKVAEENEGPARTERLIQMRKEAWEIMKSLQAYCPVLIGSVWRGTVRRGSDIDIAVYSDAPDEVLALLQANGFKIVKAETVNVKLGRNESSFHIDVETASREHAEIVVRSLEEAGKKRQCQVFGDEIKGLRTQELEKLLNTCPAERFVPF
jgi:predicted nucleotidyltransferase